MKPKRTPRYAVPGPCVSWAFRGRDERWYRVCVPCDTHPDRGPRYPNHLTYGWSDPGDAVMSARDHMRAMEANRHGHKRALERDAQILAAARAGDYLLFGRLIMRDMTWEPRPEISTPEAQHVILADYLARRND